jgi:hypothetical protein
MQFNFVYRETESVSSKGNEATEWKTGIFIFQQTGINVMFQFKCFTATLLQRALGYFESKYGDQNVLAATYVTQRGFENVLCRSLKIISSSCFRSYVGYI